LIAQQDPETGAFRGKHTNAYTGLACIALMAAGHFPNRSAYGDNLAKGMRFLINEANNSSNGYLGKDGGRMYGHGICTLAMTEAYGMLATEQDNRDLRDAMAPALRVILDAQKQVRGKQHHGGWRYTPNSHDADLSVAAWQILALRSAQNCQLPIPQQSIDDATDYVRRTYDKNVPGFTYQGSGEKPGMRAAGVVALLALGASVSEEDRKMIEESAKVLDSQNALNGGHYYYRLYYMATAANMLEGEYAKKMLPRIEEALLKLQKDDGSFEKHAGFDDGIYSTSFAIICLAVNYQFLPIYQE
jgi:hypothetical protein